MSSNGEALKVPPRPVFWEELDLLGLDKMGWTYPHAQEPLLWACDRRYFYKGQWVLEVKGGNIFDHPTVIRQEGYESLALKPVDMERLRARNEDTMFILEHEAMDFINQTYRRYKNVREAAKKNPDLDFQQLATHLEKKTKKEHVVIKEDCDSFDVMPLDKAQELGKAPILSNNTDIFVASFSGGKDSQVVLDLVTRVIPAEDFIVIYADTGYELPPSLELYEETKKLYSNKFPDLKFYTAKNHETVLHYWDAIGTPSRIHRWCCAVMKSAPLSRLIKQITNSQIQPKTMLFDGVRAEESASRANRSRIGKNVKHNNMINARPILGWNSTEVYLYIILHKLPFNQAYRNGLPRVGCVVCPYSSSWSEDLCGQLYPETIHPFLSKIRANLAKSNLTGIDNYIRNGKWKMRAGGKYNDATSSLNIISQSPNFTAVLNSPLENIYAWLNVLGNVQISTKDNMTTGILKYKEKVHRFSIEDKSNSIDITFFNIDCQDIVFIGHLKRVLYKTTYCGHCEVCEVECPTGALSVLPTVSVDSTKCIHCLRCLEFHDKGCIIANSICTSASNALNNKANIMSGKSKSSIDRYRDGIGMRNYWLERYFNTYETFFDNAEHGMNQKYQIPPFINWLRESLILNQENKSISEYGLAMAKAFTEKPLTVWELVFIGLCENSEICSWFHSSIDFNKCYTKEELEAILQECYPDLKDRTLRNPLNSLINTFKESPLSSSIPVCAISKEKNKISFVRTPHEEISLVAVAYSLYRYAERKKRRTLAVAEFYDDHQKEGPYRQFGIGRELFEKLLLGLQEESNHVLRAELNMGLDNILLRDDLASIDILKMML